MHLCQPILTLIVRIGDGPEPFLAGCVPDLQLDVLARAADCFESEVDTDGCHVIFVELVVSEPKQEATLSDWRIAYDDVFQEMVVFSTALAHLYKMSNTIKPSEIPANKYSHIAFDPPPSHDVEA